MLSANISAGVETGRMQVWGKIKPRRTKETKEKFRDVSIVNNCLDKWI